MRSAGHRRRRIGGSSNLGAMATQPPNHQLAAESPRRSPEWGLFVVDIDQHSCNPCSMTPEERRICRRATEIRKRYRKKPEREPTLKEISEDYKRRGISTDLEWDATTISCACLLGLWMLAWIY